MVTCRRPGPSPGQLLLVSLADGRLEALDRETGQPLWTFHTGAPLVSSTNRATSTTPAAGHGQAAAAATGAAEAGNRESIFPGTDGSLYVYRPTPTDGGGSGGDVGPLIEVRRCRRKRPLAAAAPRPAGLLARLPLPVVTPLPLSLLCSTPSLLFIPDALYAVVSFLFPFVFLQRLPLTVAELVHSCPAPALDGSLLMGSQHTTAFLLHAPTGRLLRTFFDFDGQLGQLDAAGLGEWMLAPGPAQQGRAGRVGECWGGHLLRLWRPAGPQDAGVWLEKWASWVRRVCVVVLGWWQGVLQQCDGGRLDGCVAWCGMREAGFQCSTCCLSLPAVALPLLQGLARRSSHWVLALPPPR